MQTKSIESLGGSWLDRCSSSMTTWSIVSFKRYWNAWGSLVERFRGLKYFHGVATPAILCHKEPARASKAPFRTKKDQSWFFMAYDCWHSNTMKILQHSRALDQWETSLFVPRPIRVKNSLLTFVGGFHNLVCRILEIRIQHNWCQWRKFESG